MAVELLLLVVAALLLLSILASKAAGWLGVPSLLLFLLLGMLAGSEGIGGIAFDDAGLAQAIGVISLALILSPAAWRRIGTSSSDAAQRLIFGDARRGGHGGAGRLFAHAFLISACWRACC